MGFKPFFDDYANKLQGLKDAEAERERVAKRAEEERTALSDHMPLTVDCGKKEVAATL